MPGLVAETETLIDAELPYPTSCASIVTKLRATPTEFSLDLAEALEGLQKAVDDAHAALRQNAPGLNYLAVTDANGDIIGQIGQIPTSDGDVVYGAHFIELYVGDAVGNRDPLDAPLFASETGEVFIGKNGSLEVLDPYNHTAAWLGAEFDKSQVINAADNGSGLIRLTVPLHTLATGDQVQVDGVGGVPNARGRFTVTVINSNTVDLDNSVFDGAYTSGGTIDRLQHITNAANNGSGAIRITCIAHGFESGDVVHVQDVGGVPDATGEWIVTVIDPDNFDLQASAFSGAYSGGGLAIRYYAGGLFQQIAIGPSMSDYRLRMFADGTLKIRNATIILTSGGNTIILDPSVPAIIVRDDITLWQVRLQDGQIYIEDLSAGSTSVNINPTNIWMRNSTGNITSAMQTIGSHGEILVTDGTGLQTVTLFGDSGDITMNGTLDAQGNVVSDGQILVKNSGATTITLDGPSGTVTALVGSFDSLTLDIPLDIASGGTGADTAAWARDNLDVYSRGQVDSMIAGLATTLNGSHDHGGAVPADGAHTHTIV